MAMPMAKDEHHCYGAAQQSQSTRMHLSQQRGPEVITIASQIFWSYFVMVWLNAFSGAILASKESIGSTHSSIFEFS